MIKTLNLGEKSVIIKYISLGTTLFGYIHLGNTHSDIYKKHRLQFFYSSLWAKTRGNHYGDLYLEDSMPGVNIALDRW